MDTLSGVRAPYPRPQMVRPLWCSLDGLWEFAFDDADCGLAESWHDGRALPLRIQVPFPYQAAQSGLGAREIHEVVWYARSFVVPAGWAFDHLLLHFGAVDYSTHVWVNGRLVGRNRGGHVPFHFNIAPFLAAGDNRVVLRVEDRQDAAQPRGKQSVSGRPVRIYYYCTTGIWQTVWMEPVGAVRIDHLRIVTAAPDGQLVVEAQLHAPFGAWQARLDVLAEGASDTVLASCTTSTQAARLRFDIVIPDAVAWEPARPHLYQLRIALFHHGQQLDSVQSYAGLRTVTLTDGKFCLNGKPTFLLMVLDQGYWPQSLLAAPSDDALRADVAWIKRFGFNGVRKHQKIESERWLYWCDRLGLLVWEEMPNARAWSMRAEEDLLAEWERAVLRDINHPSIVTWVTVVESLGFPALKRHPEQQDFIARMVARTRLLDPARPVVDNDGWEHTDVTDLCTIHDYTHPAEKLRARYAGMEQTGHPPLHGWYRDKPLFLPGARYRGQPVVLSEVGGFLYDPDANQAERRDRLFDYYDTLRDPAELAGKYSALMEGLATLECLAGICFTQLADTEHECNGLLTAARQPKLAPEWLAALHERLWGPRMAPR
jgi:hypothetical protein